MTTFTTDHAHSGDIPRLIGETTHHITAADRQRILGGDPTRNLAPYLVGLPPALRRPAADTHVMYVVESLPHSIGIIPPLRASGSDAWIGDLLQDPPTGPVPPLPPPPPPPGKVRPRGYRGVRRLAEDRRVSRWWALAAFVAGGATVYAGLALGVRLAVLAVFG